MNSPRFRFTAANIPPTYRSALITMVGFMLATIFLLFMKIAFPSQDFSDIEKLFVGAVSTFVAHLLKELVTER